MGLHGGERKQIQRPGFKDFLGRLPFSHFCAFLAFMDITPPDIRIYGFAVFVTGKILSIKRR